MFEIDFTTMDAIRRRFHRRLSEWHLAAVMVMCGFTLTTGPTFQLEPFAVVDQIAGQSVWAGAMLAIGSGRLVVLAINGALRRGSPHVRWALSVISAIIWSVLLAGLFTFGTPLLVVPFLAVAMVVEFINAFRAAQDARQEGDECGVPEDGPDLG